MGPCAHGQRACEVEPHLVISGCASHPPTISIEQQTEVCHLNARMRHLWSSLPVWLASVARSIATSTKATSMAATVATSAGGALTTARAFLWGQTHHVLQSTTTIAALIRNVMRRRQ